MQSGELILIMNHEHNFSIRQALGRTFGELSDTHSTSRGVQGDRGHGVDHRCIDMPKCILRFLHGSCSWVETDLI